TARRRLPVGHRDQRIAGAPIGSRLGDGLAEGGRARGAATGRDRGEVRPLLRAGGAQDRRQSGPLPDQPRVQRHGARRQDPRLVHSSVQGQPTLAADRPAAQALRDPLTVSSSSMVHPGRAVADVGEAVRTARGTLGWVTSPLGSMAPPPAGSHPRARAPLAAVAAAWLGVPYRLGGTLPTGIDCSGLVMRCFTAAWGVPLPRRSTDQVQSELLTERDARTDDLVLLRDGVGRAHVGLVVAHTGDGPLVVHASARRGRVVAEPLGSLAAAACDVRLAAATDLIELHG